MADQRGALLMDEEENELEHIQLATTVQPQESAKIRSLENVFDFKAGAFRAVEDGRLLSWMEVAYIHTAFPKLILWSYLYWWIVIMSLDGWGQLSGSDIGSAVIVCLLIGLALNAAAYTPPLTDYLCHMFKVSCSKSSKCEYFIPTGISGIAILFAPIGLILIAGSIAHEWLTRRVIEMHGQNEFRRLSHVSGGF